MKRILIALAVLLSVQFADAQVKTPAAAKKAVESAKAAAQDAKKATKVATWLKLANSYMDAYNAPAGSAWIGASKQELQLIMANEQPLSVEVVELSGEPYEKQTFADKEFYFNRNGQLAIINVTAPVVEEPLAGALEAFKKAYEVDAKKSKTKDILAGLEKIANGYLNDGMNCYTFGNLAGASQLFEKAAEASATEPLARLDTAAIYNAGFTAWMVKDYEKSKKCFEQCLAAEYYYEDGEVFAKLADVYVNLGDKDASRDVLEQGFAKFPQSQSILIGLINYYLENKQNPDRLFELINAAKANEPNNASLYYVEGNIYNELRQADPENAEDYLAKAVAAYDTCQGVNPEYEFGFIGKGIMFYNIAIEIQDKAANEYDDAKYQVLVEQFEKALIDAYEPFVKAYEVSKDNGIRVNVAEYLKNICYRFRDKEAKYQEGYDKYDAVVKSGQAE